MTLYVLVDPIVYDYPVMLDAGEMTPAEAEERNRCLNETQFSCRWTKCGQA